jgi:hypothetical protein
MSRFSHSSLLSSLCTDHIETSLPIQRFLYCCMFTCFHGHMFTMLLPSNGHIYTFHYSGFSAVMSQYYGTLDRQKCLFSILKYNVRFVAWYDFYYILVPVYSDLIILPCFNQLCIFTSYVPFHVQFSLFTDTKICVETLFYIHALWKPYFCFIIY